MQSLIPKKKDTTLPNPFKAGNEAGYNQALDDTSEALDVEIDLEELEEIICANKDYYDNPLGDRRLVEAIANSVEKWIKRPKG